MQVSSNFPGQDQDSSKDPSSTREGRAAANRDIQGVSPKADPASGLWGIHPLIYLWLCPAELQSSCPGSDRDIDSYWPAPEKLPGSPGTTHKEPEWTTSEQNPASSTNRSKVVFCFFLPLFFLLYLLFIFLFYFFFLFLKLFLLFLILFYFFLFSCLFCFSFPVLYFNLFISITF